MTYEPYICIKGPRAGEIQWGSTAYGDGYNSVKTGELEGWQRYDIFEREKLEELAECLNEGAATSGRVHMHITAGYRITVRGNTYLSRSEIRYDTDDYYADSESSRLLKRAEFLREVCKREGVAWLPKEECETWCRGGCPKTPCPCSCHRIKKPKCCCSQSIAMGDNLFTKIICPFCPEHGHHKQHCPMPE